ncbi:MAG: STAS domain-containing protein [Eubacteriales bacterium]|nr:STAS domain-containing protein [Eubacteriales bacterium]
MNVVKTLKEDELQVKVMGRLETVTAPMLEGELKNSLEGIATLIFDFSELEYISSAGLRVLFSMQKIMNKQGKMVIRGANEDVMEVFEVTGSVDILTIEA